MDKYTPETVEVRNAWFDQNNRPGDLDFDDIYGQQFDRWLERVKREAGAAALREFVEALYEPGLIESHGGQDFVATSVIESLARSTTEKESDAE